MTTLYAPVGVTTEIQTRWGVFEVVDGKVEVPPYCVDFLVNAGFSQAPLLTHAYGSTEPSTVEQHCLDLDDRVTTIEDEIIPAIQEELETIETEGPSNPADDPGDLRVYFENGLV